MKTALKDGVLALSLANLCFLSAWSQLIAHSLNPQAQWERYNFSAFVAALINVPLMALAFWLGMRAARRAGGAAMGVARAAFLCAFVVAANAVLQTQAPGAMREVSAWLARRPQSILALLLVPPGLYAVWRYHRKVVAGAAALVLILSPFVLFTLGQLVWLMSKFADRRPAPRLAEARRSPRALWLVFDEFDYRIAFAERPPTLRLPELDRLRAESLFAANAYPPADKTLLSMPALLTGKLISSAEIAHPGEVKLKVGEEPAAVEWSRQPSVFTRARDMGFNTAMAGWYHPYGRIIGDQVTDFLYVQSQRRGVRDMMLDQWRNVLFTIPGASRVAEPKAVRFAWLRPKLPPRVALRRAIHEALFERAAGWAVNPEMGLGLVHWTVPHMPAIYDRATGEWRWRENGSYLDNLALVDRSVGELRRRMEAAGVWDDTILLVTSDHPIRRRALRISRSRMPADEAAAMGEALDGRVPFLLKLPGQRQAAAYDAPFNTVLTQDLLLALLGGQLTTPEEVAGWLDRNRTVGESPYARGPSE